MPIYEFICESCGNKEEKLLMISKRNEPQSCSKCHQKLTKLIGNASFIFKGKGFYTTDYLHPKTLKKQLKKERNHRMENNE